MSDPVAVAVAVAIAAAAGLGDGTASVSGGSTAVPDAMFAVDGRGAVVVGVAAGITDGVGLAAVAVVSITVGECDRERDRKGKRA